MVLVQNKNMVLLSDAVEVRSGFLARERLSSSLTSKARLLQMRDISTGGVINYDSAIRPDLDAAELSRFVVQDGDVLLLNRGEPLRAALVSSPPPNTLASAHFFFLRPVKSNLVPAFLVWSLNQRRAQAFFRKNSVGSAIKMLSKQALEQLTISIPPIAVQKTIAKLNELNQRHRRLSEELQEKLDLLIQNIVTD
jgi:hypothetical protein